MIKLKFAGMDDWGRPVYKEVGGKRLYKDLNFGNGNPDIYRSSNDEFDGEPDYPLKAGSYVLINEYKPNPFKFEYQMLDRLRKDCEYFLGNGNKNPKNLWGITVAGHIEEMKKLWNKLPGDGKPERLTWEQILDYESRMSV